MCRFLFALALTGLSTCGTFQTRMQAQNQRTQAPNQTQAPVPQNGGYSVPPSQSPGMGHLPGDPDWTANPALEHSRRQARETERQRRIVDNAERLVKLTAQYRGDVERHGAVTAEDQKLLLQIEKLAREVKDRMRGM